MPLRKRAQYSNLGPFYLAILKPKPMKETLATPIVQNPLTYFNGSKSLNRNFNSSKDPFSARFKKLNKFHTLHFYFEEQSEETVDEPLTIKAKGNISMQQIKEMLHVRLRFINFDSVSLIDCDTDELLPEALMVADLAGEKVSVPRIRVLYGKFEMQETQSNTGFNVLLPGKSVAPGFSVPPPFPQFGTRKTISDLPYILTDRSTTDERNKKRAIHSFLRSNLTETSASNSAVKVRGKSKSCMTRQSSFRERLASKCNAATMTDEYSSNNLMCSPSENRSSTETGSTLKAEETSKLFGYLSSSGSFKTSFDSLTVRKIKIHKP